MIIFGKFANFPDGGTPYPSLVVAGVLPMQYFASAMTLSSMSLLSNLQLVTKVYFPRTLLPLAAVVVPLVDLVIGLPVLLALMWYYDTWPGGIEVLLAPLFIGARRRHRSRQRASALGRQRPLPRRALHDPGHPAGAAAALGRDVRGVRDPDQVAVDPRRSTR